MEVKTTKL